MTSRSKAARTTTPISMAELLLHTPRSATPRHIGWLSEVGENLRVSFSRDYVDDVERPTLSQQYVGASDAETRAILTAVDDVRLVRVRRLPTFFENLLPEGPNRTRLASRRGVGDDDELELLAAAGHDLSGALEVVPGHDVPASVLELHATQRLEPVEPSAVAAPIDDGFSLDGIVTKFSMVHDGRRYVLRRGDAAGEIIAKLPTSTHPDLVRNEATCYALAASVGIDVADASIHRVSELSLPGVDIPFDEFLRVQRFDRRRQADGSVQRIHFEELAQAIGLDSRQKYKRLDDAMRALLILLKSSSAATNADLDEVFRRWTAYSLMGNTDAHSKNWGLLYADGIHPTLAPAYDIVSVASYFDPARPNELFANRQIDVELRKWGDDRAEALARSAGLTAHKRFRKVVQATRDRALDSWPDILKTAPPNVSATVSQRLVDLVPARPGQTRSPAKQQGD